MTSECRYAFFHFDVPKPCCMIGRSSKLEMNSNEGIIVVNNSWYILLQREKTPLPAVHLEGSILHPRQRCCVRKMFDGNVLRRRKRSWISTQARYHTILFVYLRSWNELVLSPRIKVIRRSSSATASKFPPCASVTKCSAKEKGVEEDGTYCVHNCRQTGHFSFVHYRHSRNWIRPRSYIGIVR